MMREEKMDEQRYTQLLEDKLSQSRSIMKAIDHLDLLLDKIDSASKKQRKDPAAITKTWLLERRTQLKDIRHQCWYAKQILRRILST